MKRKETASIQASLSRIELMLNKLVKIAAAKSPQPAAWLSDADQGKAAELRASDPEFYDKAVEILKLFFS